MIKIKGKRQKRLKKKSRKKNSLQIALDKINKKLYEQNKNHPRIYKIRKNQKNTAEEIQSIIKKDQLTQKNNDKQIIEEFPLELLSELDSIEGKGNLAKFRKNPFVNYLKICDYFISHITQDQTDGEISKSTGLRINLVRRVLYDLFGKGIIEGVRVKDEKKGWFVYRWRWRTSEPVYGSNGNVLKMEKTTELTEYKLYLENNIQTSNQNKLDEDDTRKDDYVH
ncbi:hypothetical protein OAI67_01035 [Candidatus Nitrosopelagicus sp.]|nr:hypothetical protein [Candidatus Nitrosopelagicus sp.]